MVALGRAIVEDADGNRIKTYFISQCGQLQKECAAVRCTKPNRGLSVQLQAGRCRCKLCGWFMCLDCYAASSGCAICLYRSGVLPTRQARMKKIVYGPCSKYSKKKKKNTIKKSSKKQ